MTMGKWVLFILTCAMVGLARGQTTAVSQCVSNPGPLPINTYVEGCITPTCLLPQLQDVVLHIVFKASNTIRSMRTLARAFLVGSVGITYPLGAEEVTCNFLTNTYCPLLQNEVVQYTLRMYIEPSFFVGTSVTVEFRVEDERNDVVFCVRVPIRIIAPVAQDRSTNNTLLVH